LVDFVVSQGYPNELGNANGAGNALKSCRQVNNPQGGECTTSEHPRWDEHWFHHGFNAFGFASLPGGYNNTGSYGGIGNYSYWWSSTEYSDTGANLTRINLQNSGVTMGGYYFKTSGFNVRCVKDAN
jgi:uncharacterized protein (TIGR02145 family)